MDPWSCQGNDSEGVEIERSTQKTSVFTFEDDFKPAIRHTLPDSDQYLAILEEKLIKIKSDSNVLRQLAEKREACMQQLLNGTSRYEEDENLYLEEPISNSAILRTVLPQRQALTQGEVVKLIKYDQLVDEQEIESNNVAIER